MFSTSCCNFDVSDVCIESRRPPKGNLALNWSESMGRTGWETELETELGLVMGSVTWPQLVDGVEVTVVEKTTWVTVLVVVVFSPGLVEQFGGSRTASGFKRGGASTPKLGFGEGEVVVMPESVTILGDRDAHSLEGGDGLCGDLLSGVRLGDSPKLPIILGKVGGSWSPTEVGTVGRTGLLSSHVVTGFSGGRDMPYGMPELVGTLSRYSGTGYGFI